MAVEADPDSISDRDVLDATGRHPDEWFAFLDAQQATGWNHQQIMDWITDEAPHVTGGWADVIAVRYERARGLG